MKNHMMIKPLTGQWKKQPWLTQEVKKPSIPLSWSSSDPWCGRYESQRQLPQIHNSASLLKSHLHKWWLKNHIFKSKLLFSTQFHPFSPTDLSQLVKSFQEPFQPSISILIFSQSQNNLSVPNWLILNKMFYNDNQPLPVTSHLIDEKTSPKKINYLLMTTPLVKKKSWIQTQVSLFLAQVFLQQLNRAGRKGHKLRFQTNSIH